MRNSEYIHRIFFWNKHLGRLFKDLTFDKGVGLGVIQEGCLIMRDSYLEIQIIVDMAFFNTKQAIENITNLQKLQKCCI